MFKIKNYTVLFIFLTLVSLVVYFNAYAKISTSLESVLIDGDKKELLKKFNEFSFSKKLMVFTDNLNEINRVDKALLENKNIRLYSADNNKMQEYQKEYALFIDDVYIDNIDVNGSLLEIKNNLLGAEFFYFVDRADPLSIIKKNTLDNHFVYENAHLAIKDIGYISIFEIDGRVNSLDEYEKLYDFIDAIDSDAKIFSPIFYFVENSRAIKSDVNRIVLISTLLLILLYIVIIRDIKILLNALLTLGSSMLFALLISSFIFDEISIFVVVFGISVSSVAIDYMFHHYVHGEYSHSSGFNKDVFFGMLTTVSAFFILSNVSYDLIKQFSYFTIFTLSFSYIIFAFLFKYIGFEYRDDGLIKIKTLNLLPPKYLFLTSLVIIIFLFLNFKFDTNIKNLDVENIKLDELKEFFVKNLSQEESVAFLIKSNSIDGLIESAKKLKDIEVASNFQKLVSDSEIEKRVEELKNIGIDTIKQEIKISSKELGFRDDYFSLAYDYDKKAPIYSIEYLNELGFEIIGLNGEYISYIVVPKNKLDDIKRFSFLEDMRVETIFYDSLDDVKNSLIIYGFLCVLFIVSIVFISYKKSLFIYLAFIFFPFSMILSINLFASLNILHIFILFIILSISIDYGIYIGSKKQNKNTNKAVVYSILTTFAGFGVLIFSNINALFSIGLASSVGVLSILFLLIFLKRREFESSNL